MHPTKVTFKNLTAASLAWQLMLKECNVRKQAAHLRATIARCKSILDHYLLQICLSNAVARPQLQKPSALILRFSNPSHLVWCMAQCFTTMLQNFARHDQRRCWGRWNLMAQKIYRCVCMWVAEHVFPHISRVVQFIWEAMMRYQAGSRYQEGRGRKLTGGCQNHISRANWWAPRGKDVRKGGEM